MSDPLCTVAAVNEPLRNILDRLSLGGAARRGAARALREWVWRNVLGLGVDDRFAEDVTQKVAFKLVCRADDGTAATWRVPESYARQMIRNAHCDALRSAARFTGFGGEDGGGEGELSDEASEEAKALLEHERHPKAALEEELTEGRARARTLLGRVFACALEEAAPRYREGLQATYHELCALVFDEEDLRARLRARDTFDPTDLKALARAETAAYKNHERMRARLRQTISEMEAAGRLTPDDAGKARECLTGFNRADVRARGSGRSAREEDKP